MPFIAAIDQGTTSSRTIIFDEHGRVVAIAQREITQHYPTPGWVEHNPQEIWDTQHATFVAALRGAKLTAGDLAAIGITNQRETIVVWERSSGKPVANAIVWQDRRTAAYCDELRAAGRAQTIREKTGLEIDAYFSATKLKWILDSIPRGHARAASGELACGTIDSWLVWRLTGGRVHVTDPSNASRTMLYNLHSCEWDEELLTLFQIPPEILPRVGSSGEVYGETVGAEYGGIPIAGIAGDQQAALFGQLCVEPGMCKNTYGTGCFLLQQTGPEIVQSRHRLLTTVAWSRAGQVSYALEGSVYIGGALVQWLRDGLGIIKDSSEIEPLARSVNDSGDVYIVPAFVGLGAPYWDQHARGTIIGLTRGTNRAHIARAAEEAIAFQVAQLLSVMHKDTQVDQSELRVDGGAARDDLLLQLQADFSGIPVTRTAVTESSACGAAYLAGLAVGVWKSVSELASHWSVERRFEPSISRDEAQSRCQRWSQAVERARNWV